MTAGMMTLLAGGAILLVLAVIVLVSLLAPHRVVCVRCHGLGTVEQHARPMNRRVPCGLCDGTGWQAVKP